MINDAFILAAALFMVVKGATIATRYAALLAEGYHLSKYTVGFIVVAVISILPETFIAINASREGIPSLGLGMLFGSNVADLTLILAIIIFVAGRGLRIEAGILRNRKAYPLLLLLPLVLGLDGHFSRPEGLALIIAGGQFYYLALRGEIDGPMVRSDGNGRARTLLMLLLGMAILLVGSHFTVTSAEALAGGLGVSPILIGMFVVGLGTTMPELFFALKAVRKKENDSLVVGDILGTVLADATIVIGILTLVQPFAFPVRIIHVTGIFMVVAALLLFVLMRSGRRLSRQEAWLLLSFWLLFVAAELWVNT